MTEAEAPRAPLPHPAGGAPAGAGVPGGPDVPGEPGPSRVDSLLESARSGLARLTADEAARAQREEDALLVDIRYAALRDQDGTIPGALIVERNELEWRLDPTCPHRSPEAFPSSRGAWGDPEAFGRPVVVVCNEGYASSLAARSLHQLGLHRATDLDGGFQAWRAAGLPVVAPGATPEAGAGPHPKPQPGPQQGPAPATDTGTDTG